MHDPRSSLRTGDIVRILPGWRVSKHVRHVVTEIVAPFGPAIAARPRVPTEEERVGERGRRREGKVGRRRAKREGAGGGEDGPEAVEAEEEKRTDAASQRLI